MARSRVGRIALAVAVLAGAAVIALTPSPAGACSFATAGVSVGKNPVAGGVLHIHGDRWFTIIGSVDSMCGGNYVMVPLNTVTVIVDYQTLSGPRSEAFQAQPSGEATPPNVAAEGVFTWDLAVPIPADATSVEVRAFEAYADVTLQEPVAISGATATTVPPAAPPARPTQEAAPAQAVDGQASFTG